MTVAELADRHEKALQYLELWLPSDSSAQMIQGLEIWIIETVKFLRAAGLLHGLIVFVEVDRAE